MKAERIIVVLGLLLFFGAAAPALAMTGDHGPEAELLEQTAKMLQWTAHHGEAAETHHLAGAALSGWWTLPFVGLLLSIAFVPLFRPHFWEHHFGKVSFGWVALFLIPSWLAFGHQTTAYVAIETLLHEFVPFIILLLALFTIAGGIRLAGSLAGSPQVNTLMLIIGTVLASAMGTTGAAMLLIRPLLRANAHRRYRVHSVVFFIFLVANIGGSLSPLGDPPLFLGFLKGVPFFWPTVHLFNKALFMSVALLLLYYALDSRLFKKEGRPRPEGPPEPLRLEGGVNFLLLAGVVGLVLLSGVWASGTRFHIWADLYLTLPNLVRDLGLLGLAALSLVLTKKEIRAGNGFTWGPIAEVAKLFAGIFVTMVPALAILRSGPDGALADLVALTTGPDGQPVNYMYFWLAGTLSSFLDNAPTYVVFFNLAAGDAVNQAAHMVGSLPATLAAISAGAVFMGANTYIGNAPNFMVRSIAVENGVKMPSFFGFMAWSVGILCPLFVLVTFIFFV